jgi:hypothetical protein
MSVTFHRLASSNFCASYQALQEAGEMIFRGQNGFAQQSQCGLWSVVSTVRIGAISDYCHTVV